MRLQDDLKLVLVNAKAVVADQHVAALKFLLVIMWGVRHGLVGHTRLGRADHIGVDVAAAEVLRRQSDRFFNVIDVFDEIDVELHLVAVDLAEPLQLILAGVGVADQHVIDQPRGPQVLGLDFNRQAAVGFEGRQAVVDVPRAHVADLAGNERGAVDVELAEPLGAGLEEVVRQRGADLRVEVVAAIQVRRVGLVTDDVVEVVHVIGHVQLNDQAIRVVGKQRFRGAVKALIEPNAVDVQIREELEVRVRDPQLVKNARGHIDDGLVAELLGHVDDFLVLRLGFLNRITGLQHAHEQALEAIFLTEFQVGLVLLEITVIRVNRKAKLTHCH